MQQVAREASTSTRRCLASLLDLFPCLLITGIFFAIGIFSLEDWTAPPNRFWPDHMLETLHQTPYTVVHPFLFLLMVWCTWHFLWIYMLEGQTPGARLLRIRVINRYGEAPGLLASSLRVLGHTASFFTLGLGWLWTFIDPWRRTWPDLFSNTLLVRNAPSSKPPKPRARA